MAPFYSGPWQDPSAYRALLDSVDARFDSDARRRALEALRIPESFDQRRLDRWVAERGVMVTTGQQPGLLGGPGGPGPPWALDPMGSFPGPLFLHVPNESTVGPWDLRALTPASGY